MQLHYRSDKLPACRWQLARISHKRSAALREIGTGVTSTRFATLQGVDPVAPAHLRRDHARTRSPFAREDLYGKCGLSDEASWKLAATLK